MNPRVRAHPTLEALRPLFTGSDAPRESLARARPLLEGTHPATTAFAAAAREATRGNRGEFGTAVRSAARLDGATIAEAQQYFGLFNPTRRRELSAWQFDALDVARVPELVAQQATATLDVVDPIGGAPLDTWVFPADHANAHSMLCLYGLEAWGDLPQGIAVQVWPSPGNLNRLGPVVTRATALSVRSRLSWPRDQPPLLADFLVREGLAALAVATRFPHLTIPWAVPFAPAPDWHDALAHISTNAGVARYADLPVNIYSLVAPAGDRHLAKPVELAPDDSDYARAVLQADLGATDPARIAGYLYGDAVVSMAGHPAVGMSPFAGIAMAHTLVQATIARRGLTLVDAMRMATNDLLDGAFG